MPIVDEKKEVQERDCAVDHNKNPNRLNDVWRVFSECYRVAAPQRATNKLSLMPTMLGLLTNDANRPKARGLFENSTKLEMKSKNAIGCLFDVSREAKRKYSLTMTIAAMQPKIGRRRRFGLVNVV